jgi:sec-independent protein translocase protein TatB
MFDVSWSELLIVGIVALLVVGPKEMPALLRTVGKYVGMVRRQANEFRAQFDAAMREAELDQLRKDVESAKAEAESALRDVETSVGKEVQDARAALDDAAGVHAPTTSELAPDDENVGLPSPKDGANGHASLEPDVSAEVPRPDNREPKAPA